MLLSFFAYASLTVFLFGCIRRVLQYRAMPLHLRWELYPVPHEAPGRAKYGGSYFEESQWWTKARPKNRVGALRTMAAEILLFKTVWKSNRSLWWRSIALHAGLYCLILAVAIGLFGRIVPTPHLVTRSFELVGLILAISGALALLWRRSTDVALKNSTHPADVFQLVLIVVSAALVFYGGLQPAAPSFHRALAGILTFDRSVQLPSTLGMGLLVVALLAAYVPFSPMAHFIGKYFAYHSVRWDDKPNHEARFGSQMERNFRSIPNWSAQHVGSDGTKTWGEIVAQSPTTIKGTSR